MLTTIYSKRTLANTFNLVRYNLFTLLSNSQAAVTAFFHAATNVHYHYWLKSFNTISLEPFNNNVIKVTKVFGQRIRKQEQYTFGTSVI